MPERYDTDEVARILGMSASRVRDIARAGICHPLRRAGRLEFSFQDLVLLRTAKGLLDAQVPTSRLRRAIRALNRQLPTDRPLSGLRIYADGRQVVVRDDRAAWQPESGQTVLDFGVDELVVRARREDPDPAQTPLADRGAPLDSAAEWFERARALEPTDPGAARASYERAVDLDPTLSDAYVNLGRLAHEAGEVDEAVRLYHLALDRAPNDAVAHYNLALALEDRRNPTGAIAQYEHAVRLDPTFADAHYNLGRLLDHAGRRVRALRHLAAYRKLTEGV